MKRRDVIDLYRNLENLGITIWFDGGWGVDALLGEQTRDHDDVDIIIQKSDLPKLQQYLDSQSYQPVPRDDTRPWNFVLGDSFDRLVDIHVITFDSEGNGIYGPKENNQTYPADSFAGTGTINGQKIRCLTATHQVESHCGYSLRPKDYQDVQALCHHFSINYPQNTKPLCLQRIEHNHP